MFDFSLGEILLIGVVALVVLGPERLPVVARTLGALLARAQRFAASVKTDIQREADRAGLGALQQDVRQTAFALQERLENELHGVNRAFAETETAIAASAAVVAAEVSAPLAMHEPDERAEATMPVESPGSAEGGAPEILTPPAAPQHVPDVVTVLSDPGVLIPPERDENQLDLFDELPPSSHSVAPDASRQ